MDPDANVNEALAIARGLADGLEEDSIDTLQVVAQHAQRLAELLVDLDGWLTGGGFLPRRWANHARLPKR